MPELQRQGARIHYAVDGSGPALVLLHGFTGSAESFGPLARELSPRHTVIRVDLLGHGASDTPPDPLRYGVWQAADDVLAVVEAAHAACFDLLGYSLGGRIALRVALRAGERLRRLVIESASPGLSDPKERAVRRESDEQLARLLETQGIAAFVDRWEDLPLFRSQARLPDEKRHALRQQRLGCRPEGLAQSLRGAGAGTAHDVTARLSEIRAPTLLVGGQEDEKYRTVLQEMAQRLPAATLRLVPGSGHNVHLEHPRLFGRLVADFLAAGD